MHLPRASLVVYPTRSPHQREETSVSGHSVNASNAPLSSFSRAAIEIESLFDGIDFTLSCCRKFGLRSGKCLSDNRIDERNVHDVVHVGGSTRIKFLATGTLHGVGGLVSTHTEIVLPMSWEGRTM